MNKYKTYYSNGNNKRVADEIRNDFLMRDIIIYEFINKNQYYLKSIIDQTRK
jgi:hypothetical protein